MRTIIPALLAIGLLITASSCHKPAKLAKVTLVPSVNIVKHNDADDHNSSACLFGCPSYGTGCAVPASIQTSQVGFRYKYNAGTEPCACWNWIDCAWRAYVKFDLSTLPSKQVVDAVLHFKANKIHQSQEAVANPPNYASCPVKLYTANEEDKYGQYTIAGDYWNTFTLSTGFSGGVGNVVDFDVGPTVMKWANGQQPNHGLFLVGPNESMPEKVNQECWVELSEISLKVTVNTTQ
jgi:hypothetical protein